MVFGYYFIVSSLIIEAMVILSTERSFGMLVSVLLAKEKYFLIISNFSLLKISE
jgi:hypothetical protein